MTTRAEALRNAHVFFDRHSGWAPPDDGTLAEWLADGVCRCPDECLTVPDGWCGHGIASWKLVLDDLAEADRAHAGRAPIRDRAAAERADRMDRLGPMRNRFVTPDGIYLAGNSLGPSPIRAGAAVADAVAVGWGRGGVAAWQDHDWWTLPTRLGDRIGSLVGAAPGQVVCGDSTSIQCFQAVVAMARLRPERRRVLIDAGEFPTDRYVVDASARLLGLSVERLGRGRVAPDMSTAVVLLSAVDFATAELADVAGITEAAHAVGAPVVWDLSHAAGALPVALDDLGVDAAVGCTYKYLCAGPGAPAYLYVAGRHHRALDLPLTGWNGHAEPFAMADRYRPAAGIGRARIGTPPVLSMVAADAALDVFDGVDMAEVRAKSLTLTDLIMAYADDHLGPFGVTVATPRPPGRRGSHVALRLTDAYPVSRALIDVGVTGDFRAPDLLRLGVTPLSLTHVEVWDAMAGLRQVLDSGAYRNPAYAAGGRTVT